MKIELCQSSARAESMKCCDSVSYFQFCGSQSFARPEYLKIVNHCRCMRVEHRNVAAIINIHEPIDVLRLEGKARSRELESK